MFRRVSQQVTLAALIIMLLAFALSSLAQGERALTPGISLDSELSEDGLAQVFTYEGNEDEIIKLTLISADGLALGVLMTDATGEPIAQVTDAEGNGFLVLDNVGPLLAETYYVTVFPLAVADLPTTGEFSISLALSNETAAEVVGTAPPTDAPELETALAATEEATDTEDTTALDADAVVGEVTDGQVATTGGIQVGLTWNATSDFNLEVRDPEGGSLFWDSTTVDSGGVFETVNANGFCETFTANAPTESVSWGSGVVPAGTYEILVFYVQDCEANGAVNFDVTSAVDGVELTPISGTLLQGQVFIASFVVSEDGSVTVRESGVDQGGLPAAGSELVASAVPITVGTPVNSIISNDDPFQSYAFDANAGDVITASLTATSGSLDTYLFMLDAAGAIIAENDDVSNNGENLNSEIPNFVMPSTGTFTLVASRYGQTLGGTEGAYTLSVAESAGDVGVASGPDLGLDVPDGIIEVSLQWGTNADLQLLVRDPAGDAVFDDSPAIASGGQLILNGNANCDVDNEPSYTIWPAGQRVRPGTYEIDVWYQNECNDTAPASATLTVAIAQEVIIEDVFTPIFDEHYITTFTINVDGSVVRGPGGIAGGSETIDYTADLASAPPLTANIPVTGNIADANRFDVYTFDGTANEVVSIRMEATAGTLDTLLFLVGPTGVELASNDDIVPGENRNSLISEFTLPQSGQYIVLATHYGTIFGGTNGVYTLTLSR